jgi:hypothetical protein
MIVKDLELPPGIVYRKSYRRPGRRYSEDSEQTSLFDWTAVRSARFPVLGELYHVPNQGSGGRAGKIRQAKFKRMGLKPGIWDVCWDAPRYTPHIHGERIPQSLRIEMKANSNNLEIPQIEWAWTYYANGYKMYVCYTWQDAALALIEHFGLPLFDMEEGPYGRTVVS